MTRTAERVRARRPEGANACALVLGGSRRRGRRKRLLEEALQEVASPAIAREATDQTSHGPDSARARANELYSYLGARNAEPGGAFSDRLTLTRVRWGAC